MKRALTVLVLFLTASHAASSLPAAARQAPSAAPAVPDVFKDPESLVRGIYAAVSFDPGPAPDWEFVKTFFLPQAVIVIRKALIVTDRDLIKNTDISEKIRKALGNLCVGIFSDVELDSGIQIVNQGAKFGAGRGADCLVSVGGGSAIDTAKGMAILMKEGGRLQDYAGFQVLTRPQTPHVVIQPLQGQEAKSLILR